MGMESGVRPGTQEQGPRPTTVPRVGVQSVRQPAFGSGIVVSLIVFGLVLVLAISALGDADGDRIPLLQTTNALYWGLAVIVVLVAAIGAQYAERNAAQAAAAVGHPRPATAMATAWTVPAVATLAAVLLVATYHNGLMLLLGPLIALFGTAGALLSRDLLDDVGDTTHRTATVIHTLVIHAIAFLALGVIYYNKLPTWLAASFVGFVGSLLILETLERGIITPPRRVFYALLGGGVMAEAMVAVNWWQTHGWSGGAVLLVCFYLTGGVLLARSQRSRIRSRDLVEFGLVSLVAYVVLASAA